MAQVEFMKRPKITRTATSTQRRFESKEHPWAIIEVEGVCGHYWLAIRKMPGGEYPCGKFKHRTEAERACCSGRA